MTCCCCNLADKASATETTTACKSQQLMRSCVAITTTTRSMHESICVMRPNHLPESIHFRTHTHTHTHIWVWTRGQIHTHTYHIWVWTRGQTHTHSHVFERIYWHEQTSRCNHSSQQPQAGYELWKRHATCDMWHEIRMSLAWCIPMNLWHIRIQCKQRVFGQRHFTVLPTRFILLPLPFDCASAGPMLWSSTFGQISNEHQPAPPPPPL